MSTFSVFTCIVGYFDGRLCQRNMVIMVQGKMVEGRILATWKWVKGRSGEGEEQKMELADSCPHSPPRSHRCPLE